MPKKIVWAVIILVLLSLDTAVIFYLMERDSTPSPTPLQPGPTSFQQTGTFADTPIPKGIIGNRIIVEKRSRTMTLYRGTEALKSYRIALGGSPEGPKEFEGDQKTPEGIYSINGRNPASSYHLSLRISYPSTADTLRAEALGKSAGCDIMIHGLPNGFEGVGEIFNLRDWTAGCVAVTNSEIEEIWRVVPDGTVVEIRP